jgi:lipopolysaccharide transport system ATP-binding protein
MLTVEVHNLAKCYRLGGAHERGYKTLRDTVSHLFNRRNGSRVNESLWALQDVSFELSEGEALGVIGRNGAGKSTLLKILSRITEPTLGRARLHGRVASLLEVGTGFHPELTGRENIYLNGAILGMTRAEIRRDFDAIVAFAEIDRFLDTPVKRYSSGMQMRLAFAVAAHLTPEILIVDEVLAVGDYEFQRRCLGQMNKVAHSGRTVLFVSHNMNAIEELCPRTILLKSGRLDRIGPTRDVVAHYLHSAAGQTAWDLEGITDRDGTGHARLTLLELLAADTDTPLAGVSFRQSFRVRLHYEAYQRLKGPRFGFALLSEKGERVFLSEMAEVNFRIPAIEGKGWLDCLIMAPNVLPGAYFCEVWIVEIINVALADHVRMVGRIEINVDAEHEERLSYLTWPQRGHVFMNCRWSHSGWSAGSDATGKEVVPSEPGSAKWLDG